MPTAFDTAQYTANWDPTKTGTFVSPQDVLAANGNMWAEVWTAVVNMIPTLPQIETIFENNLAALFTAGTTTTTGTSYPILTWLDSLTGLNLVGLAESLTGLNTTGSSTILAQLIGAAGGSGATLSDWTAVFDAFLTGDAGVEISAYNALITALFGSTTLGAALQISAIPTGIPQANISGLTADLVGLLSTSTFDASWNALMTALFGSTTLGTALQISALPTNIPQSSVSGLATALTTFLTTGNYNTLLTALFGSTTVGSTIHVAAVPTGIPQANISGLGAALATFLTTGNYNTLLTALFGTTTVGTTITTGAVPTGIPQANISGLSTALATFLTTGNYNTLLTALFGSTTITPTINVLAVPTGIPQASITGLVSALTTFFTTGNANTLITALFGSTTVGTTVQVGAMPTGIPQANITGLVTALGTFLTTGNWNTLLTALFGTTTVGSTVQVTALPTGIPQANVTGLVTALATFLTTGNYNTLLTALFGSTTVGSTISTAAVPTGIPQANISGLVSALTTFFTTGNANALLTALYGTTTVGSTVQVSAVPTGIPQANITGLATALATFLTTGNYNTLLTALFGTTTVGSTISVSAVPAGIPALNISGQFPATQVAGVQGITDMLTTVTSTYNQLATALGWDPASGDAALATLAGFLQGTAQNAMSGADLGQANSNVLGQVNNASSFDGLDTTSEANMPISGITNVAGNSQNASMIGFVRCKKAGVKGAISFRAASSNVTHFYVNAFRFNLTTGNLTYLWSSADLLSSLPASIGWVYYPFAGTNQITVAAGDVLAFELQPVTTVTGGVPNSALISGYNGIAIDNHPNAKQKNIGATRVAGTTPPTGNILPANYTWRSEAPYISLEITDLPASYMPPEQTNYSTPGTTTWTPPSWMVAGNLIDCVVLGGGGGGGFVNSGAPGTWATRTLVVGTDVAVGAPLTVVVGAAGVYPSSSSGASSVLHSGTSLVSGAGGANYANTGGSNTSPGNEVFNAATYFGGTNVGLKQNGSAPGGGGSYSADANAFYDTAGAAGAIWITARQF